MVAYLGKWGEEGFGRKRHGAAPDGSPRTGLEFVLLELRFPRSMSPRIQLVVIRQADGAQVLVPRVAAPSLLLPRPILRALLPLPPFSLLLALRSGGISARAAVGESFVLLLRNAALVTPSPGNHVARDHSSGSVHLQSQNARCRERKRFSNLSKGRSNETVCRIAVNRQRILALCS